MYLWMMMYALSLFWWRPVAVLLSIVYRIVLYRIVSYRCIAQLLFILSIVVDILSRSVGGTFYGIHLVAKLIYREKARMKNKELAIFHDNDFYFIFIFYRFNTTPTIVLSPLYAN